MAKTPPVGKPIIFEIDLWAPTMTCAAGSAVFSSRRMRKLRSVLIAGTNASGKEVAVRNRTSIIGFGWGVALLCLTTWASAGSVTFDMNIEFSGAQAPAGAAPWLRATFDDGGGTGSVTMKLIALNLTGSENVDGWYLNLDPSLDPTALTFSTPTKTGSFDDPSINTSINAYKADGDGKYDIRLDFTPGGNLAKTFSAGDTVQYTITGISSLAASSFNFLSFPDGGHGPFLAAAHVQNTTGAGSGGSGWVAPGGIVPLPAGAWMGASLLGAIGLIGVVKKRRQHA